MTNLPLFIAFKNVYEKDLFIYKFDGKDWYLNEKDTNKGFEVKDFVVNNHCFLKGKSLEEINEEVRRAVYKEKYGQGKEGDCQCPNCGFWHSFNYTDYNDGYYTPGINEDFSEERTCICGKEFEFKIKVKIEWNIESLD